MLITFHLSLVCGCMHSQACPSIIYLVHYIYDGLERHSGGRFESEMYSTRSDWNRKNNCVRTNDNTHVCCNTESVKYYTVNSSYHICTLVI